MSGLVLLAVLAAYAVMASAVADSLRVPLAGLVLLQGLVQARRARDEPARSLQWAGGAAPARLSGAGPRLELHAVAVEWRGPIVRLQGRDARGRTHRLVWWPDTLTADARRRLMLAARAGSRSDISLPSMAA